MPTYVFHDTNKNKIFEAEMRISELDLFLEDNSHIKQLLTPVPTVGGIAGVTHRTDDGWKETLAKISESNPYTPVGKDNRRKSAKDVATENAVEKWRKKRAASSN